MSDTPEQNSNAPSGAPPPPPAQPSVPTPPASSGSQNRTIMLILSYFGIFGLIPLLVEKEDAEVQWHAKHGLVLTVCEVVIYFGLWLVLTVLGYVLPILGCLLSLPMLLLPMAIIVLHVVLMVKAVNGERLKFPVVTDYAEKWK